MVVLGGWVFLMSEVPLYRYLQPQDALFFDAPTTPVVVTECMNQVVSKIQLPHKTVNLLC